MECEFSVAGCDAKVYRKDLPSHLEENMGTHMSLLSRDNKGLKQELEHQALLAREHDRGLKQAHEHHALLAREHEGLKKKLEHEALLAREHDRGLKQALEHQALLARENEGLKKKLEHQALLARENEGLKKELEHKAELIRTVQRQRDDRKFAAGLLPPLILVPNLKEIKLEEVRKSAAFYSGIAGYKLQLEIRYVTKVDSFFLQTTANYLCKYIILANEFVIPPSKCLQITSRYYLSSQRSDTIVHKIACGARESDAIQFQLTYGYFNDPFKHTFKVLQIEGLNHN